MGNKCFIKFIIPCWSVQTTIGKMLDSILQQTFKDYHIVCVEDKSPDKTWQVLQTYKKKYPDKITLIKNKQNLGAAESRNQGYLQTKDTIPSEYLWVVDGDDYLAGEEVLQKIHDFAISNPQLDIINIGWTFNGQYAVARCGWPVGLPGRVIRSGVYVQAPKLNLPKGNDVYPHFVMFDKVDDQRIGKFDYKCYVCPKPGRHQNNTVKNLNIPKEIGKLLKTHQFKKKYVVDEIMNGRAKVGSWIKSAIPDFHLVMKRKVSIFMASFPFRKKWMLRCIDLLIGQCDNFYLWLNEYKEIPPELLKYDQKKLHIWLSKVNMKENGRYVLLNKVDCQNDYCFICDDDIIYPKNYVQNTLQCFRRKGDGIVTAYYVRSTNEFEGGHSTDEVSDISFFNNSTPHYRFGLGTAAFVPSEINFKVSETELDQNYDVEMLFGQQCHDKGIKVITPKRPVKFVVFIKSREGAEVDKFALHMNGSENRTKKTYEYIKKCREKAGKKTESSYKNPSVFRFQFG